MKLPQEVPVMTLPNATLFPQALLPLYIFEPRYRRMLADALKSDRMFSVAMQKPGRRREAPAGVAGLGLIRAAVEHADGTSHLVLQGIARVELEPAVRYRPYRIHRIRPIAVPPSDDAVINPLVVQVRDLLAQRMKLGLPFPFPLFNPAANPAAPDNEEQAQEILNFLDHLTDPNQVADLVSCAVLPKAAERQTILETANLESRLNHLIRFLVAELRRQPGKK
ncbi:MAG TPA: LON peptidase substrate-binding domain-containing protein [Dongiaceae bacterium]|jgi:Lon protease-like protein|nr:LON peptidase substrate-binding domain-containing protein [Dongiaceae bacterium]